MAAVDVGATDGPAGAMLGHAYVAVGSGVRLGTSDGARVAADVGPHGAVSVAAGHETPPGNPDQSISHRVGLAPGASPTT